MCLFANCLSSLVKYLIRSFACFCISYHSVLRVPFYLGNKCLSDSCFVNIFSQCVVCVSFQKHNSSFLQIHDLHFVLYYFILGFLLLVLNWKTFCFTREHKDFLLEIFNGVYTFKSLRPFFFKIYIFVFILSMLHVPAICRVLKLFMHTFSFYFHKFHEKMRWFWNLFSKTGESHIL